MARLIGMRIIPPKPGEGKIQQYSDGSYLFVPTGSAYNFDICIQAIEIKTEKDGSESHILVESRHMVLRPYKTARHILHVKDK